MNSLRSSLRLSVQRPGRRQAQGGALGAGSGPRRGSSLRTAAQLASVPVGRPEAAPPLHPNFERSLRSLGATGKTGGSKLSQVGLGASESLALVGLEPWGLSARMPLDRSARHACFQATRQSGSQNSATA